MDHQEVVFGTVEKQRRPSPRAVSTDRGRSSPNNPHDPKGSSTPRATSMSSTNRSCRGSTSGSGGGGGGAVIAGGTGAVHARGGSGAAVPVHGATRTPPPPQRDTDRHGSAGGSGGARGGGGGDVHASPRFTSPASAFSSSPEFGRAMTHLLDSVASPSSISPTHTPPRSALSSPATASGRASARRGARSHHRWISPAAETTNAPLEDPPEEIDDHRVTDWEGRTPPQQHRRDLLHATSSPLPSASREKPREPASLRKTTTNCALAGLDDPSGIFTCSLSLEEEEEDASSTYSSTPLGGGRAPRGSHWASPSEVLQLRKLCRATTTLYQQEVQTLRAALARAQEECVAYAQERDQVLELQKTYRDGLAACGTAKQLQSQWAEEKALQKVEMDKLLVENQRLQLYIAKKHKASRQQQQALGASAGGAEGSSDRMQAASRALANVAATAAVSNRGASYDGRTTSPPFHLAPSASWPRMPMPMPTAAGPPATATAATSIATASSLTTAGTTSSSAYLQRLHSMMGAAHPPMLHDTAVAHGSSMQVDFLRATEQTTTASPYTYLSSLSSSPESPLRLQQQQQQHYRGAPGALPAEGTRVAGTSVVEPLGRSSSSSPSPPTTFSITSTTATATRAAVGGYKATSPLSAAVTMTAVPNMRRSSPVGGAGESGQEGGGGDGEVGRDRIVPQDGRRADNHQEPLNSSLLTPSPSISSGGAVSYSTARGAVAPSTTEAGDVWRGAGQASQYRTATGPAVGEEVDGEVMAGEADFDPSYTRGITEFSSTSHQSSLPSVAVRLGREGAEGTAEMQEGQTGRHHGRLERGAQGEKGEGGAVPSTAGEEGAFLPPAVPAARDGKLPAETLAPTTFNMTPSLGSTATTNASVWSLQYLYQLPRTPAEALEEALHMQKEMRRLEEEKAALEARLHHTLAMQRIESNQREQKYLQLSHAHELTRRSASQWELSAQQRESEVTRLQAQVAEAQEVVADLLQHLKRQQAQSQAQLLDIESSSRAALASVQQEASARIDLLKSSLLELARQRCSPFKSEMEPRRSSSSDTQGAGEVNAAADRQETLRRVQSELHGMRVAYSELQDRHTAFCSETQMMKMHLEGSLARTQEMLAAATNDKATAELRVDQLEAEVERLRDAAVSSEASMRAVAERLQSASNELETHQELLDVSASWQARALAAEDELLSQRTYYEAEINVYKTAANTMQEGHHKEIEALQKRCDRLRLRYEAMKMRLVAHAVSHMEAVQVDPDSCTAADIPAGAARGADHPKGAKRKSHRGETSATVPDKTVEAVAKPRSSPSAAATGATLPKAATVPVVYDSLRALRTSAQVTERLVQSLNRETSGVSFLTIQR